MIRADISLASSSFDVISSLLTFDKLVCPFLTAPITYLCQDTNKVPQLCSSSLGRFTCVCRVFFASACAVVLPIIAVVMSGYGVRKLCTVFEGNPWYIQCILALFSPCLLLARGQGCQIRSWHENPPLSAPWPASTRLKGTACRGIGGGGGGGGGGGQCPGIALPTRVRH